MAPCAPDCLHATSVKERLLEPSCYTVSQKTEDIDRVALPRPIPPDKYREVA
jgi:hypothetical protein